MVSGYLAWILVTMADEPGPSIVQWLVSSPPQVWPFGRTRISPDRFADLVLTQRGDRSVALLPELLASEDERLVALGLSVVTETGSKGKDAMFAAADRRFPPGRIDRTAVNFAKRGGVPGAQLLGVWYNRERHHQARDLIVAAIDDLDWLRVHAVTPAMLESDREKDRAVALGGLRWRFAHGLPEEFILPLVRLAETSGGQAAQAAEVLREVERPEIALGPHIPRLVARFRELVARTECIAPAREQCIAFANLFGSIGPAASESLPDLELALAGAQSRSDQILTSVLLHQIGLVRSEESSADSSPDAELAGSLDPPPTAPDGLSFCPAWWNPMTPETASEQLAALSWDALGQVGFLCPEILLHGPAARKVLARAVVDRNGFLSWRQANQYPAQRLLEAAVPGALADDQGGDGIASVSDLASADRSLERELVEAMGLSSSTGISALTYLELRLTSSDPKLAAAAATAILRITTDDELWARAASVLSLQKLDEEIDWFVSSAENHLYPRRGPHPSPGPGPGGLPSFPWPPPQGARKVMFGVDLPRELLGKPGDTLEAVHLRLVKAMQDTDVEYEARTFKIPGGFVVMTRMQQTDALGVPLQSDWEWRSTLPAPSDFPDYLMRLFLAPPGYYRIICFVFADADETRTQTLALPDLESGGSILPRELATSTYRSKKAYALVYAFRKPDFGKAKPYGDVGGTAHLERSGIIRQLAAR